MSGCIILPCEDISLEICTLTISMCGWQALQVGGHRTFSLGRDPRADQTFYTLSFSTLYEGGEGNWQQYIPHRSVIEQSVSVTKGVISFFKPLGEDRIQYRAEIVILLHRGRKIQHIKASLHTHLHFVQKRLRTVCEGGESGSRTAQA